MRHVMRVHRVDLDTLWERLRTDPSLSMRYVGTKQQLADILTKGSFTKQVWDDLRGLIQTGPGYKKVPDSKVSAAATHIATLGEIYKCKHDLAILRHCDNVFKRQICRNECSRVPINRINIAVLDSAPVAAPALFQSVSPPCSRSRTPKADPVPHVTRPVMNLDPPGSDHPVPQDGGDLAQISADTIGEALDENKTSRNRDVVKRRNASAH